MENTSISLTNRAGSASTDGEPWRISLLGNLQVQHGGLSVDRFTTRKAVQLLAFLAPDNAPTDRDTIATRL